MIRGEDECKRSRSADEFEILVAWHATTDQIFPNIDEQFDLIVYQKFSLVLCRSFCRGRVAVTSKSISPLCQDKPGVSRRSSKSELETHICDGLCER